MTVNEPIVPRPETLTTGYIPLPPTCEPVCAHGLCRCCGRKLEAVCEDCADHKCEVCDNPLAPSHRRFVSYPTGRGYTSDRNAEYRICCCTACFPKLQKEADKERARLSKETKNGKDA